MAGRIEVTSPNFTKKKRVPCPEFSGWFWQNSLGRGEVTDVREVRCLEPVRLLKENSTVIGTEFYFSLQPSTTSFLSKFLGLNFLLSCKFCPHWLQIKRGDLKLPCALQCLFNLRAKKWTKIWHMKFTKQQHSNCLTISNSKKSNFHGNSARTVYICVCVCFTHNKMSLMKQNLQLLSRSHCDRPPTHLVSSPLLSFG